MIAERISKLRDWMVIRQLSAFIIPSADPHLGEYIAPVWKSREWISGFTGSAGTVVVTLDQAGLWTDSRYFIQAAAQLEGSGINLHKSYQQEMVNDIPHWLLQKLPAGSRVGIDGNVCTWAEAEAIRGILSIKKIALLTDHDPMQDIWEDRPSFPLSPARVYGDKYTGCSASERLLGLRRELERLDADTFLVTSLDEIAWVLNIRGSDVDYNPLLLSYLLLEAGRVTLFVDPEKCPEEVETYLSREGVAIRPYGELAVALSQLEGCRILLPPSKTTVASCNAVHADRCTIVSADSPLTWMKCIRTETELEGLRRCMERDGVALVRFQRWLTDAIRRGEAVTEMSLDRKLYSFRAEQELFQGESFGTIAGYGAHAASPHYSATPETDALLEPRGYLLLDSGGHYLDGTTDITRTIVLGPLTEEEKQDYTCVLKGHINLASARFPKGTNGTQLDVLARVSMWKYGMQYLHGTGHGVGYYLNVHEGTDWYQIRTSYMPHPLMLDSTLTNEPALYKAGSHGVRIENLMRICLDQTTEFGDFYCFEPLTLCPIDMEAIQTSLLTRDEIEWLNKYHAQVYDRLSPFLKEDERRWLYGRCVPISCGI